MVEVSQLPLMHQAVIPVEYLDEMNHMNVMWYVHLFDRATWRFFASVGMDMEYYENEYRGAFALEQHTRYLAEVRVGHLVSIYTRALGRSAKSFHFMHFMLIEEGHILAATTELVGIHIDRRSRRSSPLPTSIAASFDQIIAAHNSLSWDPPVSGTMGP